MKGLKNFIPAVRRIKIDRKYERTGNHNIFTYELYKNPIFSRSKNTGKVPLQIHIQLSIKYTEKENFKLVFYLTPKIKIRRNKT